MDREEQTFIRRRALVAFGPDSQWRMLQEECSELAAAISRIFRPSRSRVHAMGILADEVADVEILLETARELLGDDVVDAARKRKLIRLAKRLEDKNYSDQPTDE